MKRKYSIRTCFIALGALRALLCLTQCRQGMTLQLPIRRTTSYHFDPFSKYFNAHVTLSKALGWKLWLDINFHNMNQIKFPYTKSWNGPQMTYVYLQFSSPRSKELIASWVNWPTSNSSPEFSVKNSFFCLADCLKVICQTQEKKVIFFCCSKMFFKEI